MARGGGHDEILQAQHLGLLPDVPPGTVFGGRLVEEGHGEERRELGRRRAPGVGLHSAAVVERRVPAAVPVPPEVAVGTEEGGGGGAAEDGPRGAAVGAERGARVAGADPVGAVHEAVARQAEPGGVGAAVHRRRRAVAIVTAGRLRAGLRLPIAGRGFLGLLRLRLFSWPPLRTQHLRLPLVVVVAHAVGLAMASAGDWIPGTELARGWEMRSALCRKSRRDGPCFASLPALLGG